MASERDPAPALRLWVVLSRAHAAIEAHARAHTARHGLTLAEFAVLEALHHKGRMLLNEVQRRILVSSGGITYLVDRLQTKGLVERQPCTEDRRASWATLTSAGKELIERIFPEHAACLSRAMSALEPEQQRQAAELIRALGIGAADTEPCGAGE